MSIRKISAAAASVIILSACSNDLFIQHNGNMPTEERIAQVKTGQTKGDVREVLGSPSTVVALDKDTWIYMSSDVKKVAFFKPEEVDRDVLTLRFDRNNKLEDITRINKSHGKEVVVSEDATETVGHKSGFFKRFFGGTTQYAPFGGYQGDM